MENGLQGETKEERKKSSVGGPLLPIAYTPRYTETVDGKTCLHCALQFSQWSAALKGAK